MGVATTLGRPNGNMADKVDRGILMLSTHGESAAVAYMTEAGVPRRVIQRVLAEPQRRRALSDPAIQDRQPPSKTI